MLDGAMRSEFRPNFGYVSA